MSKFIIAALAAATLVPGAAQAQSAREVRQGQREVQQDLRRGDYQEAREDRRELREDWRDYRRAHPKAFRTRAYAGPSGYRYRPVTAGYQFQPQYYGNRYWVNNYANYRLPHPGRGLRYIRYGNDVLLVNTRTGRVVRVYNRFFM